VRWMGLPGLPMDWFNGLIGGFYNTNMVGTG
jgi:hypothetical protein